MRLLAQLAYLIARLFDFIHWYLVAKVIVCDSSFLVMPVEASIQGSILQTLPWTPACTGVTMQECDLLATSP